MVSSSQTPAALFERLCVRLRSERLFLGILALAFFLPLWLSRAGETIFVGLPLITSGDEPHYLVMIQSLIDDGDLNLDNNYLAARQGALDVGRGRAGVPLDRHVEWYAANGKPYEWSQIFEYPKLDPARSELRAQVPRLQPGAPSEFVGRPQYSQHPPGLAVLLAPVLFPFRGTRWVEHFALFFAEFSGFLLALSVRAVYRTLSSDSGLVNSATLITVLCSPLWYYGRTLFTEPWLTLFAVAALAAALRKNWFFASGLLIALGMQMKPPFALFALPLAVDRLLARDVRGLIAFSLPVSVSFGLVLAENQYFFGSVLHSAQPWASGNPLLGLLGLLFSWNHGLLWFSPVIALGALGFRELCRTHPREAWLSAGMAVPYFLLMSLWRVWDGGYCYGPRLIAPTIPFAFFGIIQVLETLRQRSLQFQRRAAALCGVSFLISALGAVLHLAFWNNHPLVGPFIALARIL
ncbi:MAG TPA: hypothetical protein VHV51_19955 [Polyangiaceae bacterium]|jgi:hypothetical protein|nr:hypothetical protein [Polyangiaceae bacterium]